MTTSMTSPSSSKPYDQGKRRPFGETTTLLVGKDRTVTEAGPSQTHPELLLVTGEDPTPCQGLSQLGQDFDMAMVSFS